MFLGALGASLFGNLITDKGVKQSKTLDCVDKASSQTRANIPGQGIMAAGEGTIRAGQNF